MLVSQARAVRHADVLGAPLLIGRDLLREDVTRAGGGGDIDAGVPAEDRDRLVRGDDASGELLTLDDLQVLASVDPIRGSGVRQRSGNAGAR